MTALPVRDRLTLPTPEGVTIGLQLASAGERLAALVIDAMILAVTGVLLLLVVGTLRSLLLAALAIACLFLLRVFYFVWLESRVHGSTWGKRWLGLRVVRADGGPLTVEAVLARNFTRELELFVPLQLLFFPDSLWPGQPAWARLCAGFWVLGIATMPLWSRSRLRLGDLIAGTRVVCRPRATLLGDLSRRKETADAAARATFTAAQLGVYGSYELQVLEDVLRRSSQPGGKEAVAAVCRRIQQKIRWQASPGDPGPQAFLEAFYAAQRRHLEQHLQFGRRKERKDR